MDGPAKASGSPRDAVQRNDDLITGQKLALVGNMLFERGNLAASFAQSDRRYPYLQDQRSAKPRPVRSLMTF